MVILGDGHDVVAKGIASRGFEFRLFDFPWIDFLFTHVIIIEGGLSSDQAVDILFDLSVHHIFEQRDRTHTDMKGPVVFVGAVYFF